MCDVSRREQNLAKENDMIDAEKLLGGLLSGGLGGLGGILNENSRSRGIPGGTAIGMGLLGVAMAAFEHFTEQRSSVPASGYPVAPMPYGGQVPPPAPGAPQAATPPAAPGSVPPPTPAGMPTPPPAPGAVPGSAAPIQVSDPMVLIRAMIASAHADGVLDDIERMRIIGQLEGVGLTEEEKDFLTREFDTPWSIAQLAAAISTPAMSAQVYTVSLLAIDVDTQEERDYLDALRQALGLDPEAVQNIARRLGKKM